MFLNVLEKYVVDRESFRRVVEKQNSAVRCMHAMGVDVSEIFSPSRVCAMAAKFGLRPGFPMTFKRVLISVRRPIVKGV